MFTATSIPVKIPLIFMSFLGKTTVIFISCSFALLRSKPLRIHMSISLPAFPSHLHWTISGNAITGDGALKFLSAISNMRPGFCTFIQNSQKVLHAQGFRQAHRYYPADDEICPRSKRQVPAVSTVSPWNQRNSFWISVSSATEYPSFWQMDSICLFGIPVFGFLSSKYRIFDNN